MLLGALIVLVVIAAALRERRVSALTALSMTRRRLGPDGIVVGGGGFTLERPSAPAVLLIHGAGDTPQTLRYLGEHLHARGFHVVAPLLPGHGRSIRDFMRVRAEDLTEAVRAAYLDLRSQRAWTGVIGLSMGGALGVQLAAEFQDMPALGLAAPYLEMPRRIDQAARMSWLWGPLIPIVESSDGLSVFDPVERERNLAYGVFTAGALRALHETVRRASAVSAQVRAPTLVVQSREDNRISIAAAEGSFARLGAQEKRLEWISGASHVITVDYGREHVFDLLASWMEQHGAAVLIP